MKEFQNKNPLRQQTSETVMEQAKPLSAGRRREFLTGFLFLFVLVCLLGGIVSHYSRYSTDRKFVLRTEESGVVSDDDVQIAYQRLLVRNRYPFELTITAQFCRMDSNTASPRFSMFDKRSRSFTGTRSLFTGTFEARVNIVVSGDGRFCITDSSGQPEELLNSVTSTEQNIEVIDAKLRAALAKKVCEGQLTGLSHFREDQKTYGKEITWICSLPGDPPDKVLVITLRPKANYER
jgi:hypothetical protein